MRAGPGDSLKAATVWIALIAGQIIGGMVFLGTVPPFPSDGPMSTAQAMLLVAAIDAIILTLLAIRMRARGRELGLQLGLFYFGVQSFQSLVEALIFGSDVHLPADLLLLSSAAALVKTVIVTAALAWLWRGEKEGSPLPLNGLGWKAPAVAVLYAVCYFAAGHLIAWQSAAVRTYYAHYEDFFSHFDAGSMWLLAVQLFRGLLWGALAWIPARVMSGSPTKTALLVGIAFSGIMVPQLFFPNPIMPWPVREMHMIEVGVSNFIFGVVATLILLSGQDRRSAAVVGGPRREAPGTGG
jgi:hypothetical protein